MFVESDNQGGATVIGKSTRLGDVTKKFFGQKISEKRLIDTVPTLQAKWESYFHATLADYVAVVADPDRGSSWNKETGLAAKKLNQISVEDNPVSLDCSVHESHGLFFRQGPDFSGETDPAHRTHGQFREAAFADEVTVFALEEGEGR